MVLGLVVLGCPPPYLFAILFDEFRRFDLSFANDTYNKDWTIHLLRLLLFFSNPNFALVRNILFIIVCPAGFESNRPNSLGAVETLAI